MKQVRQPVVYIGMGYVVFIAVVALAMLLGPARISVLLATLGWFVCAILGHLAILDGLVFVTRIVVARHWHDGAPRICPPRGI